MHLPQTRRESEVLLDTPEAVIKRSGPAGAQGTQTRATCEVALAYAAENVS